MAFTIADFLNEARFAAFNSLDEDIIASELAYVAMLVPASRLCPEELDEGRKLYLAHLLTVGQESGINGLATGAINSINASQGSNSFTFAAVDGKADPNQLNLTTWGVRYQALVAASACNFQTGFIV